jgi:hypothetical protein
MDTRLVSREEVKVENRRTLFVLLGVVAMLVLLSMVLVLVKG